MTHVVALCRYVGTQIILSCNVIYIKSIKITSRMILARDVNPGTSPSSPFPQIPRSPRKEDGLRVPTTPASANGIDPPLLQGELWNKPGPREEQSDKLWHTAAGIWGQKDTLYEKERSVSSNLPYT